MRGRIVGCGMSESEDAAFALLMGELGAAAKAALIGPLKADGATEEAALKACEKIAGSLAVYQAMTNGGHDPFNEIGRVREALARLESELSSLSIAADGLLLDALSDAGKPGLFPRRGLVLPYKQFRDALPAILEALPARPTKKGGHDSRLHRALRGACMAWWSATGRLPPATKAEDGAKAAALYRFVARHAGAQAVSLDTWVRVLKGLRPPHPFSALAEIAPEVFPQARRPSRRRRER